MTDETKKRALKILERRDMSVRELTDKLAEKGETPEDAAECAEWLVGLGFLNDEKYAGLLVRHYAGKGYGESRIRSELHRRGISRELWDEALDEMPEQDSRIDALLRAKLKSAEPDRAELKKATDALMRRGFSWDEIRAAVERYSEKIKDNSE